MKVLPVALAAHMGLSATTLAWLFLVTRADGAVYAFTSASSDVKIGGVTYLSGPGLDVSAMALSAGMAVDNMELTTLDDGSVFVGSDVLSGKWRNAEFTIGRCNYVSPEDGVDTLMCGSIGNVIQRNGYIVAELRGLQQVLQQDIGSVTSKTCRARLGDDLCTVDLTPWTHSASVTGVTSNQVFEASGLVQAENYFRSGILTWTSGPNNGLSCKVKAHASGGALTLVLPAFLTVAVGNAFTITAGCDKRLEDCRDKFDNVLNMQAEPHLPGVDAITSPPA